MFEDLPLRNPASLAADLTALLPPADRADDAFRAAAIRLSQLDGFNDFSALRPAASVQGMLKNMQQLQQASMDVTATAAASLAALSGEQADFACLSMLRKHFQRKRESRDQLLLVGDAPALAEQALAMGFQLQHIELSQAASQASERAAALIWPLDGLQAASLSDDVRLSLQNQGVLIVRPGVGRYFVAHESVTQGVDLLSLDLSLLCEVDAPCIALLASPAMQDYLPLPRVTQPQGRLQWQTMSDNPFSIGRLNNSATHAPAMLQCLTQLSLQGPNALLQRSLKAMVSACYLSQQLSQAGFPAASAAQLSAGRYVLQWRHDEAVLAALQKALAAVVAAGVRVEGEISSDSEHDRLYFSRLHHLSHAGLDVLAQRLREFQSSVVETE